MKLKNSPVLSGGELKRAIRDGIELASLFGSDLKGAKASLEYLMGRLDEERFHLAVLGQFKRGKSTFLNALIGENILPFSVVPLTAIPTFLRGSEDLFLLVRFVNGESEKVAISSVDEISPVLEEYVTEEKNPQNEKGVAQVEVMISSPILEKGVVLIDTPGIGSTFRHNTEVTLNFLAECDAALFMVSADPPITEVEIEFLREVKKKVSRLFFVINKMDYLDEGERKQVREFIQKMLEEQADVREGEIFLTSAREGLSARQAGKREEWEKSGMGEVEKFLVDFLAREKERVFVEAISKKVSDVLLGAQMRLNLLLKSYRLPMEELEEKVRLFSHKVGEVERQKVLFDDLLRGERKRTVEFLEEQAGILRREAREYLESVVDRTIAEKGKEKNLEKIVRDSIADSIPGYFERVMGEMSKRMEEHILDVLSPFEEKADELVDSIRKAAATLFDVPYRSLEGASRLVLEREPYWVTHKWSSSLSFVSEGTVDAFLPPGVRKGRVKKRMMKHVEDLVLHNVENLRWVTLQNVDKTFRKSLSALSARMGEALESTRGAMEAAMRKRVEQSHRVRYEEERLSQAVARVEKILERLDTG